MIAENISCSICHGDGLYLRDNTRIFCARPEGQRRKLAWIAAGETVKVEADRDRQRRWRKVRGHDFKAEAVGERMPGEEG